MRFSRLLLPACLAATACGGGAVVTLGDARPAPYHFGTPRSLVELGLGVPNENPTLTADLLDLYFSSSRGVTNGDVWTAHRAAPTGAFDPPSRVEELSTPLNETSPAISLDGLTLYVGSDRGGVANDMDIWRSTRPARTAPWPAPELLPTINTATKDIPRPVGQHGLVMPLSSERDTPGAYQTFLAARPTVAGVFGPPIRIAELTFPGSTTVDAALSDDGLTLFFASSTTGGTLDLFVAWRQSTSAPFSVYEPLADVNSTANDRDPWLSPDGTTFYFTSDRDGGVSQIYEVAAWRGAAGGP